MGHADDHIRLEDIKITPAGQSKGFELGAYNASAPFKIPNLVLNATSLNTGHSWHFTSSWVGEPNSRSANAQTLDTNCTLEQLRFDHKSRADRDQRRPDLEDARHESLREAKLKSLTLADAVAASACVPGLFTPLAIHDLDWNSEGREIVVELVDGGVFDNQGIDALYVQECTDIICSDASGQLEDERAPSSQAIPVVMRSNSVMMDRIRDDGYYDLYQSERGDKLLREPGCADGDLAKELRAEWDVDKFAFFHLRQAFASNLPDYPAFPGPVNRATASTGHVYRLSNIRTDLDSFSDIEAYSLMYDGYCLSNEELSKRGLSSDKTLPAPDGADAWRFLQIRQLLAPSRLGELLKHLKVGAQQFFKVFRLGNPWAIALAIIRGIALAWLAACLWHVSFGIPAMKFTVGGVVGALLVAAALGILKKLESTRWMGTMLEKMRWLRRGQTLWLLFLALGIVLIVVWVTVTIHLLVFDPLFLSSGKIRRRA